MEYENYFKEVPTDENEKTKADINWLARFIFRRLEAGKNYEAIYQERLNRFRNPKYRDPGKVHNLGEKNFIKEETFLAKRIINGLEKSDPGLLEKISGWQFFIEGKLADLDNPKPGKPITNKLCLELIFQQYGNLFEGETPETWLTRFSQGNIKIDPIKVEKEAKPGSSRIVLIAILSSIQKTTGNGINFEEFVNAHFGISNFQVTKSRSRDQKEFKTIVTKCDQILKNDIIP